MSDDITSIFIENLSKFADRKEITITRLCEILKIPSSSFYRWKLGKTQMQMETAQKLVVVLNTEYKEELKLAYFLMGV